MKTKICLIGLLLAASVTGRAALYSYSSGTLNTAIPDYNTIGLTLTAAPGSYDPVFTPGGGNWSTSTLTLTFTLTGGAVTDLSGYLRLGNLESSPSYNFTSISSGVNTINFDNNASFATAFSGQNPDNTWTLYFADTVNGDTTTLNGWSLEITAVPEPANVALAIFGAVLAIWAVGRRLKRSSAFSNEMKP